METASKGYSAAPCFDSLLAQCQQVLLHTVVVLLARSGEGRHAEDLLQDANVAICKTRDRFKGDSLEDFGLWASSIARNAVSNEMRSRSRAKRLGRVVSLEECYGGPQSIPASAPPHDQRLEEAEVVATLLMELERLNPVQAQLIRLHFLESIPVVEIAKGVSRTEGAIRKLLSRSVRALAHQMYGLPRKKGKQPKR